MPGSRSGSGPSRGHHVPAVSVPSSHYGAGTSEIHDECLDTSLSPKRREYLVHMDANICSRGTDCPKRNYGWWQQLTHLVQKIVTIAVKLPALVKSQFRLPPLSRTTSQHHADTLAEDAASGWSARSPRLTNVSVQPASCAVSSSATVNHDCNTGATSTPIVPSRSRGTTSKSSTAPPTSSLNTIQVCPPTGSARHPPCHHAPRTLPPQLPSQPGKYSCSAVGSSLGGPPPMLGLMHGQLIVPPFLTFRIIHLFQLLLWSSRVAAEVSRDR